MKFDKRSLSPIQKYYFFDYTTIKTLISEIKPLINSMLPKKIV